MSTSRLYISAEISQRAKQIVMTAPMLGQLQSIAGGVEEVSERAPGGGASSWLADADCVGWNVGKSGTGTPATAPPHAWTATPLPHRARPTSSLSTSIPARSAQTHGLVTYPATSFLPGSCSCNFSFSCQLPSPPPLYLLDAQQPASICV